VEAALFEPPDAHQRFAEWRTKCEAILEVIDPEQIRIDTGRAVGGDFVRVWLPPDAAAKCAKEHP